MLRRTLYIASWQVYMGDGSNALFVMEDISKTLYWRREAFCESKTLTYLTVFSCIYCCVQYIFYPTFKMGNLKYRILYMAPQGPRESAVGSVKSLPTPLNIPIYFCSRNLQVTRANLGYISFMTRTFRTLT